MHHENDAEDWGRLFVTRRCCGDATCRNFAPELLGEAPPGLRTALGERARHGPGALGALGRLDREYAAVYFQISYDALREPMRRALEALGMERQTEGKATLRSFAQQILERGIRERELS